MLRAESNHTTSVVAAMTQRLALIASLFVLVACQAQGDDSGSSFRSLRWAVVDSLGGFVGWLTGSPNASDLTNHGDIFSQWPADVFVTEFGLDATGVGEWGFSLRETGPLTDIVDGPVRFTGLGCTGTAHGWIATSNSGAAIPAPHCSDQGLDFLAEQGMLVWRYPSEAEADSVMDQQWPDAMGFIVQVDSGYYLLPRDQPWPEMLTTKSFVTPNGVCKNAAVHVSGCSVRLLGTTWTPAPQSPVYSFVELEDAP
jgi:hypothetical protein